MAVLSSRVSPGETHRDFNDRKERQFAALLDRLTVIDALALHKRLASPRPDDALARAFSGLVVERRNRLLAFIGDTRRRIALRAV